MHPGFERGHLCRICRGHMEAVLGMEVQCLIWLDKRLIGSHSNKSLNVSTTMLLLRFSHILIPSP